MRVSEFEHELWCLDQRINDRGILIDTDLAHAAMTACEKEKRELDAQVSALTGGAIDSGTQRQRIFERLKAQGVALPDLTKNTVDNALDDETLTDEVRALLQARQIVSKASTAKYARILGAVGPDNRLRGSLQYCGASRTGRWAGRIFQPQNMPRPSRDADAVLQCVDALKGGYADLVYDNMHEVCADSLRSLIIAPPGKQLVVADYSSIEGRARDWLAHEQWKLDAYHDGRDMYVETYRATYGLPADAQVSKGYRQHGKVLELSMGYEGGVGALVNMAGVYRVDLAELGAGAWGAASADIRRYTKKLWNWALMRPESVEDAEALGEVLYRQLECAKLLWRAASPEVVRLWGAYDTAAREALQQPGAMFRAGRCEFRAFPGTLTVRLPSGRVLFYHGAKIHKDGSLSALAPMGGRANLYGGFLTENITQAVARDLLAVALMRTDKDAGLDIVLHVHDEIIAEADEADDTALARLCDAMEKLPRWAVGLPVKAEGYTAPRYRKD